MSDPGSTAPADSATPSVETSPSPAPTATIIPLPTAGAEEQVSDTESIRQYVRGYNLLAAREYPDAERQFQTVVRLEPEFAHGWDGIGQSLMYQGLFEESLYYFDKAIELRPTLARAYSNRALARLNTQDIDGAERDARQALRLDDESVDATIAIARILSIKGDLVAALSSFEMAIELAPEDGAAYWWRGRFWRDFVGDLNLALDDFDRAIELEPAVASIYLDRAVVRYQGGGDLDLIKADLEEAISLSQEPRLPTIIERAGELLDIVDALIAQR
jgi:tetratricopeptide (TPR) repeat protein